MSKPVSGFTWNLALGLSIDGEWGLGLRVLGSFLRACLHEDLVFRAGLFIV